MIVRFFSHIYLRHFQTKTMNTFPCVREILPSVGTVKLWGFKRLWYDKEKEVTILRKKRRIFKNLRRHNFNYISQFVTSSKVKIADMTDFNERIFCSRTFSQNSEGWIWFFTCCSGSFKKLCICFLICCHCLTRQMMFFFPCVVTIRFIRNGCVLSNCHCSHNKQDVTAPIKHLVDWSFSKK